MHSSHEENKRSERDRQPGWFSVQQARKLLLKCVLFLRHHRHSKRIKLTALALGSYVSLLLLSSYAWDFSALTGIDACVRKDSKSLQNIARDTARYFESQGILAYPWVLTMVAALRYGANSVVIDGSIHTVDHDIDIAMIIPRNRTVQSVLFGLADALRAAGHWATAYPCGLPKVGQFNPTMLFLGAPTANGWMQATTMVPHVAGTWVQRSSLGKVPLLGFLTRKLVEAAAQVLGFLLAPFWSLVTVIDFHYDHRDALVDTNRSVLWAGQVWPFPLHGEKVFRESLVGYIHGLPFGDSQIRQKITRICDLYLPQGHWREDVTPSEGANRVSRACGGKLSSEGHLSLSQLCSGMDQMPVEKKQWPTVKALTQNYSKSMPAGVLYGEGKVLQNDPYKVPRC